jgi:hypothetical protein
MKMNVIAALALLGFAGRAGAEVKFDQGVDLQGALSQAADVKIPEARVPYFTRYTRDCSRFTFDATGAEATSARVNLASTEYVQDCHNTGGYYVPGPNGQPGHYVPGHQDCYERPGQTWRQSAQVHIAARALLPWERETVDVCLEGPWLSLNVVDGAYKYKVTQTGNFDVTFDLAPLQKTAMKPDLDGVNMTAFSYDPASKKFKVTLADKWAKEYAGEKLGVKIELRRDVANWFDSSLGSKEFSFDAAPEYGFEFSAPELDKGAKKYYLKWSFRRLGAVSKDAWMEKGETIRLELAAAPDKAYGDLCSLVMDSPYTCVYSCKDGSYISKPNFPGGNGIPPYVPAPPLHGCPMSVPQR